jgi:hypothetical protein
MNMIKWYQLLMTEGVNYWENKICRTVPKKERSKGDDQQKVVFVFCVCWHGWYVFSCTGVSTLTPIFEV